MMDCLIVWAALGPVLAFIAGAIVVAWWDAEEEPLLPDLPRRSGEAAPGGPGQAPSFDLYGELYGRRRSVWVPLHAPAAGHPGPRATRSCVQCGRMEERP